MSEYEPKLEVQNQHEKLVDPEHQKHLAESIRDKAEKARHERSSENLKKLHELARDQAEAAHKTPVEAIKDQEPETALGVHQSLKTNAYTRTLQSAQQKLPKSARLFSQLTHNKTVEALSNASAQTVARPSGLLGGSICAFLGSVTLLYYSKHYGFTYNYALFLILFIGGFIVGAILELAIWAAHRRKHGKY